MQSRKIGKSSAKRPQKETSPSSQEAEDEQERNPVPDPIDDSEDSDCNPHEELNMQDLTQGKKPRRSTSQQKSQPNTGTQKQ